ncbi:MAG: bifunctional DNA-formamidopyrimidine glycosylase/DNA-(apurinic or apyrimidinic site) lyase [Pseudomonadota bacterium]
MPELPEVEVIVRALRPSCVGRTITGGCYSGYRLRRPVPPTLIKSLSGTKIMKLERRGKYIVISLARDSRPLKNILLIHLGMSGVLYLSETAEQPKKKTHEHIKLTLSASQTLTFRDPRRFGFVDFCDRDDPALTRLGYEPLSPTFCAQDLYTVTRVRKQTIKSLLLNQQVIAGIGNIYASEALFVARIAPSAIAGSLTRVRVARLHAAIRDVLTKAIKAGGSSMRDYHHPDGNPGYFQHRWQVYGQQGMVCPRCVSKGEHTPCIVRTQQQGRATYHCRRSQRG